VSTTAILKKETPAISGRLVQITFQSFSNTDPRESVISRGGNENLVSIVVDDVLVRKDNTALLLSLFFFSFLLVESAVRWPVACSGGRKMVGRQIKMACSLS